MPLDADSIPTYRKLTSVFLVDEIEPCLAFWVDRLGFDLAFSREDSNHLSFAILKKDDVEIVYQTRASLGDDIPGIARGEHQPWIVTHIEVDTLDHLLTCLDGIEIVAGPRTTFFGTQEIYIREPSGRVIAFQSRQRVDQSEHCAA
jgi:catechol 2,3-dioxygenase-like lactoylglutathione lyase family enzyme